MELEFTEGMQFDKGYISPYFVTDPDRMESVLDDPYILLVGSKISAVRDLLPVLDNLDRALAAARTEPTAAVTAGVELIQRELLKVLEKFGLTPFSSVGQPFDPERHEAVARVNRPDLPEMTVANETGRGYLLNGRVLRPAMVTVAMAADEQGPATDA
jgi:hypothetical protein